MAEVTREVVERAGIDVDQLVKLLVGLTLRHPTPTLMSVFRCR